MEDFPNSIEMRDAQVQLHPYANARKVAEKGAMVIERGEGIHVFDTNGRKYIEAMSGLWSAGLGFSERRLVDAAIRQMEKLPFYHVFSGRSHGPAVELAERLLRLAPVPMSKVFFTNSGSEANDTAVKMLWYRAHALGQPERRKIITRLRGYHGVTIVSGSMTGLPYNHKSFGLPLPGFLHTGSPHFWRDAEEGETETEFSARRARELDEMIRREGPETIAGFFAEPVAGAGGVLTPPEGYWPAIQAVLKEHGIPLVADEVICGFGRTGNWFGCQTYGIEPDMMILSKQLSSSYQPVSAILVSEGIYGPIADESARIGTFGHGFTGGGHPVATAVALECLKVIEERDLIAHVREVGAHLQAGLRKLADHPLVGEHRGVGLIAALELVTDKDAKTALEKPGALGLMVAERLEETGVILRAAGDALAFCPPMIIEKPQVDELLGKTSDALDHVSAKLGL